MELSGRVLHTFHTLQRAHLPTSSVIEANRRQRQLQKVAGKCEWLIGIKHEGYCQLPATKNMSDPVQPEEDDRGMCEFHAIELGLCRVSQKIQYEKQEESKRA